MSTKPKPTISMKNLSQEVALSWRDLELPLSEFLKCFKLPQIVQIAEGIYGQDEESTLSQGQQLNLHLLKDMKFYSGFTEAGETIRIPFNSPRKVRAFAEKNLDYSTIDELCAQFPRKYKYIRVKKTHKNHSYPTETLQAGTILETLYFDKDIKRLICLDNGGREVSLELQMFTGSTSSCKPLVESECVFIGEVVQCFPLPITVQFVPQNSEKLSRGFVQLTHFIVDQTVIATTRDEDAKPTILTFPSTLDVTVLAPKQADSADLAYRRVCELLNQQVDLEKVKETIENSEDIYDDVRHNSCVKTIPYAEAFFGIRTQRPAKSNNNEERLETGLPGEVTVTKKIDTTGYVSMEPSASWTSDASPRTDDQEYDSDNYIKVDDEDSSDSSGIYEEPMSKSLPWRIDRQKEEIIPRKQKSCSSASSPTDGEKKKVGLLKRFTKRGKKKSSDSTGEISPSSPSSGTSSSDLPKTWSPTSYELKEENIFYSEEDISGTGDDSFYEYPDLKPIPPRESERRYSEGKTCVIPVDRKIEQLTIQEVGMLLHDLHLGQYGGVFEKEQVDGKILMDLNKDFLVDHFKMTPFHAHKLIKAALENWRPSVGK